MNKAWTSLSGHPLRGQNLAKIAYLDESGISNIKHEPFVMVAGVIVDADKQLVHLERTLAKLADRHIPEAHREGFFFHAKDLIGGAGPVFGRNVGLFTPEQRMKIALDLAAIPRKLGLPIAFGQFNRNKWRDINPKLYQEAQKRPREVTDPNAPEVVMVHHAFAFLVAALDVELWMRQNAPGEVALLIAEDNEQTRHHLRFVLNMLRDHRMKTELGNSYFPLRKIKASPAFEMKQDASALQMADFCSYVMKRQMMNDPHVSRMYDEMRPMVVRPKLKLSQAESGCG